LVCFGVETDLRPTVVALRFEKGIFIAMQVFDCLLPVVVALRVVVFGDEDDCVVEYGRGVREEEPQGCQDAQDVEGRLVVEAGLLQVISVCLVYDLVEVGDVGIGEERLVHLKFEPLIKYKNISVILREIGRQSEVLEM
jgi:hypothetical protein